MNHYETVTLLVPNFSDKDVQKYIEELSELLTRFGATEIGPARVDRRSLAYPIKKHTEGYYIYIECDAPPTMPEAIRIELKHRDGILRLAFVRRPKFIEPVGETAPPPDDTEATPEPPADSPELMDEEAETTEETREPVSATEAPAETPEEPEEKTNPEQADG